MSETRPIEWQWKTPQDGTIDGLTRQEWQRRGVTAWATQLRRGPGGLSAGPAATVRGFDLEVSYAPATADWLPAAWPAKMDWQWRRLDADMDERTWRSVPRWKYGNQCEQPWAGGLCRGIEEWDEEYGNGNTAKAGEWWAPADQDGYPCPWPDERCSNCHEPWTGLRYCATPHCPGKEERVPAASVEPQPVVVIPAAEMTPLVLYGHQAMGGTWRWRHVGEEWSESDGPNVLWDQGDDEEEDVDIEWTSCDGRGDFCELRGVVSAFDAEKLRSNAQGWKQRAEAAEQMLQDAGERVVSGQHDWRGVARKMQQERDGWQATAMKNRALAVRVRDVALGLGEEMQIRMRSAWDGDQ